MRARSAFSMPTHPLTLSMMALACLPLFALADNTSEGKTLLQNKCAACHIPTETRGLNRIDQSRRTPEGWDMTIQRMIIAHGVKLTEEERGKLVKYLADTHGLAPEEAEARRYLLERDFTSIEQPGDKLVGDTCARCHSYGRIALQRRSADDWLKLVNYHVGQYPVIEIQASGRDRDWWDIATRQVAPRLGKIYGNDNEAWTKWQRHAAVSPAGEWRLVGHRPGWGAYEGVATIKKGEGEDRYILDMSLNYANGKQETAKGAAVVYTGYEWRASVHQGDMDVRQVFTISADGQSLTGRWYQAGIDSIGGRLQAVRSGSGTSAQLLAVEPSHLKAGSTQRISLWGNNLSGEINLGRDVEVLKLVERSEDRVVMDVRTTSQANVGRRTVKVGDAALENALALYQTIDYLSIEPDEAMAHIGGNGGSRPKIPVQFESVGYSFGPDGQQGTDDDVRLGYFPARWSADNLNAYAAELDDLKFSGTLQPDGLFIPADAGPNPARKFGTNNAGELKITAIVEDDGRRVEASKPLVVTVQRWNDPSIR